MCSKKERIENEFILAGSTESHPISTPLVADNHLLFSFGCVKLSKQFHKKTISRSKSVRILVRFIMLAY